MRKILGWGGLVAALVLSLYGAGMLDTSSLRVYNLLFRLRGERVPTKQIVIVTIDEDSFDELRMQWPWPRAVHGELLDTLRAGKPAAIGLDLIFSEPSARGADDDAAFGKAVAAAGNVILAAAPAETVTQEGLKINTNLPLLMFRQGAAGFGPVSYPVDRDANVRRALLTTEIAGAPMKGFLWHLYRLGAQAGIPARPLPPGESFLINFRGGPGTYHSIAYYRIVNGEVSPKTLEGKIVLVGATTANLHDVFPTPFAPGDAMPGVEVHANALETLFTGDYLRETPLAWTVALVLMMAFGSVWITVLIRPMNAFLTIAAVWLVTAGIVLVLFTRWHIWFDVVAPSLSLGGGYFFAAVEEFVREQRQSRRLSRFFSPGVLKEIVRARSDLGLGSARRTLTILFADIRGFTAISERLAPEQVAELLGEYLTELTEVVFEHGGTVDKYVGDCIVALYNVPLEQPDHAAQAVRTAIEFQERTRVISERWRARTGVEITNGVGIHTGEAVVGTLGSRQRLEYTAIGDTVNLASRLEGITKRFGTPIIVSESTCELLNGEFSTRPLGEVPVRGREEPVRIHAILGPGSGLV